MGVKEKNLDFERQIDVTFKKMNGQYAVYSCKFKDDRHMENYIAKMERERGFKYITINQES